MASNGTEGAARVADVLLLFTGATPSLGVTAVARRLGFSKAVVHRILRTLVDRQLLASDPATRGYRLGPAAAAIGAQALRDSDLRTVALPVLHKLQAPTGETTTVSSPVPGGRVYLAQVESGNEIKMTVELGRRFPLHAGASSRAILAFLPPAEQEDVIASATPLTAITIVDPARLRASLEEVRRQGVAQSEGEREPGASAVAAPVFDLDGRVTGAISVCGPISRMGVHVRGDLVPLVRAAADGISQSLGWRGGLPDEASRTSAARRTTAS
jgi:DNA-binding IclR family transcriptional regulator